MGKSEINEKRRCHQGRADPGTRRRVGVDSNLDKRATGNQDAAETLSRVIQDLPMSIHGSQVLDQGKHKCQKLDEFNLVEQMDVFGSVEC